MILCCFCDDRLRVFYCICVCPVCFGVSYLLSHTRKASRPDERFVVLPGRQEYCYFCDSMLLLLLDSHRRLLLPPLSVRLLYLFGSFELVHVPSNKSIDLRYFFLETERPRINFIYNVQTSTTVKIIEFDFTR